MSEKCIHNRFQCVGFNYLDGKKQVGGKKKKSNTNVEEKIAFTKFENVKLKLGNIFTVTKLIIVNYIKYLKCLAILMPFVSNVNHLVY